MYNIREKVLNGVVSQARNIFVAVGVGGIVTTLYLLSLSKFYSTYYNALSNVANGEVHVNERLVGFASVVMALSLIILSLAILFKEKSGIKILCTVFSVLVLIAEYLIGGISGNITALYPLTAWMSFAWLSWVGITMLPSIKAWLKGESGERYDAAKLTLVWAVLTFALGVFIRFCCWQ